MSTLADVALLAQVSKATASRAFSRPDSVAPPTAQRVFDAAAKLGFVANAAARQLAKGRTGVIGLVVPTLDNSFFTPIIGGAQRLGDERDMQLTVVVHHFTALAEVSSFERISRQADGFIFAAPRGGDELVRMAGTYKPTVLLDREVPGMDSVIADTATAFGQLTDDLVMRGHHELAYIGGPEGSWQDSRRLAAVRAAAEASGARVTSFGPVPATLDAGIAVAGEVQASGATAVIPYAAALGVGIQYALLAAGSREIPLISTDPRIVEALAHETVPTIDVDGEALGRAAAETLINRIDRPDAALVRRRLPVPVAGRSAAPQDVL